MIDKTLDRFLIGLFGTGGATILALAWVQPMPLSERILTTVIGATGILWVSIRLLRLRSLTACLAAEEVPVEVNTENEQC